MTTLLALALAPLVLAALGLLDRRGVARAARWLGPRSAAFLDPRVARRRRAARAAFAAAIACGAVAALSTPVGTEDEAGSTDVVVCLDVSRSMLAGDVAPDRLARAKAEIGALVSRARDDRVGLVAFAGEARRLVPLTDDGTSFTELLDLADPTSVARGGTDLGAALDAALAVLGERPSPQATVLLVTDGEDHGGRGLAAARRCAARGVVVHAVGIGTAIGGKIAVGPDGGGFLRDRAGTEVVSTLDPESLSRIAASTGGTYVDASAEPGALVALYERRIARDAGSSARAQEGSASLARASLAIAVLLFLLDLMLVGRRR